MADNRYGGPGRGESIFDDDGRDRDRQSSDDRGFLQRAGDEIRSMFRDEGSGEREPGRGRSAGWHHDDHYHSWRDRQIEQFDRDYDEYRRERQQQFGSDFETWRSSRDGGPGGSTALSGVSGLASGKTGSGGQAEGSGTTTGGSGTEPMASGGASASGGANLSATEASTGSNSRTGKGRKAEQ